MFSQARSLRHLRSNNQVQETILWLAVIFYGALIMIAPNFSPLEDFMLPGVIHENIYLSPFVFPEDGRFFPLTAQEFNLVSYFTNNPSGYYLAVFIQFVFFCYAYFLVVRRVGSNKFALFSLLFILLTPGAATAWFRLVIPERGSLLWFSLFLAMYFSYLDRPQWHRWILVVVCANLALYYKEPGFFMLGCFSASRLYFTRKECNSGTTSLDIALTISSFVFGIVYYSLIWSQRGEVLFSDVSHPSFFLFARAIVGFATSDPILFFMLPTFIGLRAWNIMKWKADPHPIYDSLLFAAGVYFLTFLALRMYQPYYLLPAYIFAIPALIFYFRQHALVNVQISRLLIMTSVFLVAFSSLPLSLHLISYYKYLSENYSSTLDFLASDIKNKSGGRHAIFLDGIRPQTNQDAYYTIGEFLQKKGLSTLQFDLKSDLAPSSYSQISRFKFRVDATSPYSVYRSPGVATMNAGDYLIVGPESRKKIDGLYLTRLTKETNLVYRTFSPLAIPNVSINNLLLTIATEKALEFIGYSSYKPSENWALMPNYYVYVRN